MSEDRPTIRGCDTIPVAGIVGNAVSSSRIRGSNASTADPASRRSYWAAHRKGQNSVGGRHGVIFQAARTDATIARIERWPRALDGDHDRRAPTGFRAALTSNPSARFCS